MKANGHKYFAENWFATVLRVQQDQVGTYRYDAGFDTGVTDGQTWIAGRPLPDKGVITLGSGDYLVVIKASNSQTNPWGMIQIKPKFSSLNTEEAEESLAHLEEKALWQQERYQAELAYHQRTGASVENWSNFAMAEGMVYANIRHFIRDGGFKQGLMNHCLAGKIYCDTHSCIAMPWAAIYPVSQI